MAGITMCSGMGCPLKWQCYRFRAIPNEYQSYFLESPYDEDNEECEHYWDINGKRLAVNGERCDR